MNALTNTIAKFAVSTVFLGTMAYGQGPIVKVKVPFDFRTANGSLPAGSYTIKAEASTGGLSVTSLRNDASRHAVFAVRYMANFKASDAGKPLVTFQCGEDGCALSGIRMGDGTTSYYPNHQSKRDKEVAISAVSVRAVKAE